MSCHAPIRQSVENTSSGYHRRSGLGHSFRNQFVRMNDVCSCACAGMANLRATCQRALASYDHA